MTHLFKVALDHADVMIRKLDFKLQLIEYQVVDKITGIPQEPIKQDKFGVHDGVIMFDKNRTLHIEFAKYIETILNSK